MNIEKDLQGKYILVTGSTSGIGRAIVVKLAESGAKVVMVARNEEKLISLQKLYPEQLSYMVQDLIHLEQIESIFRFIEDKKIKLDGFVHSAGISANLPVKSNDIEVMKKVMSINYFSFIEIVKYFGRKKYSNDHASIVALSSIVSLSLEKGLLLYATSKAALNASVQVMAKELLKRGIRVNAILPGNVRTEMFEEQLKQIGNFEAMILEKQPLGIIDSRYVADFAAYLLSSYSKYMTGLTIPFDAGYLLKE